MTGKKRKRTVFVNPPGGDMSIASTATNRRVREEQTLAPPRSPEKRAFDNFDHLMGYEDNEDGFMQVPVCEGPVAIKIKAKRYMNSVCVAGAAISSFSCISGSSGQGMDPRTRQLFGRTDAAGRTRPLVDQGLY
jgi:hypothetical protein